MLLGGSSLGEGGRLHSGRGGLEHIEGNENNCCRNSHSYKIDIT